MKKLPFLTLGFGTLALFVFGHPCWAEALEFSRTALAQGELWRLFTGHLTHFSAEHLKWDLAVFVALGSLVELRRRSHFIGCVLGSALLISLGLTWLQPQFVNYRGLSGIDSALFGYIAMDILMLARVEDRRGPATAAVVAMVLFVAKIVFELATGCTVFVDNAVGFSPVPLAHLIGALVGCMFGGLETVSLKTAVKMPSSDIASLGKRWAHVTHAPHAKEPKNCAGSRILSTSA